MTCKNACDDSKRILEITQDRYTVSVCASSSMHGKPIPVDYSDLVQQIVQHLIEQKDALFIYGGGIGGMMGLLERTVVDFCQSSGRDIHRHLLGITTHYLYHIDRNDDKQPWIYVIDQGETPSDKLFNRQKHILRQSTSAVMCLYGGYGTLYELFNVAAEKVHGGFTNISNIWMIGTAYKKLQDMLEIMQDIGPLPDSFPLIPITIDSFETFLTALA